MFCGVIVVSFLDFSHLANEVKHIIVTLYQSVLAVMCLFKVSVSLPCCSVGQYVVCDCVFSLSNSRLLVLF